MIRFYLTLGLFFSFPFLWLALAFWSWVWVAIALLVAISGAIWFRSGAFKQMLKARHARVLGLDVNERWLNEVLIRITHKLQAGTRFQFWRISESEAQALAWVGNNEIHLFFSQGLLAKASEEQLTLLLQNILRSDLKQVRLENRLYALSLWWDELKGEPKRFRYWFLSFWLYPLERALKIAKI